jgi:hypothetical protein
MSNYLGLAMDPRINKNLFCVCFNQSPETFNEKYEI